MEGGYNYRKKQRHGPGAYIYSIASHLKLFCLEVRERGGKGVEGSRGEK
jgi:hypothetical protein